MLGKVRKGWERRILLVKKIRIMPWRTEENGKGGECLVKEENAGKGEECWESG
jgi:hypothetical protein